MGFSRWTIGLVFVCLGWSVTASAGTADVRSARAECNAKSICRFVVAVMHADTGWRHYADRWEVVGSDDEVIATRVLRHPHEHEQPFIRSLEGVEIPPEVNEVTVRAHDNVHGFGGKEAKVKIRRADEPGAKQAESDVEEDEAPGGP